MKKTINSPGGKMKLIILRYGKGPGILWIHGGGYAMGMASMVYYSMGRMLAKRYGGVVISPEYRLAKKAPYPAALEDCYAALKYMYDYADELGIDRRRIIVGGESAGGGLAAAVCMYERNHWGWSLYLRGLYGTDHVPAYASPARATDYCGLPPCYTYVEDGEPFYDETMSYVRKLREAGVVAKVDVFHGNTHGFDFMFWTKNAKEAKKKLIKASEKYMH